MTYVILCARFGRRTEARAEGWTRRGKRLYVSYGGALCTYCPHDHMRCDRNMYTAFRHRQFLFGPDYIKFTFWFNICSLINISTKQLPIWFTYLMYVNKTQKWNRKWYCLNKKVCIYLTYFKPFLISRNFTRFWNQLLYSIFLGILLFNVKWRLWAPRKIICL